MSPELLGELFKAVVKRLETNIPDLKTVQVYNDQLVDPTKTSFNMPAAFVHMVGGSPTDHPNPKVVEMTMRFVVLIVTRPEHSTPGHSLKGMSYAQRASSLLHKSRLVSSKYIRPAEVVDFSHLGGNSKLVTYSIQFDQPVIISKEG